mmetsp:Transcript_346/g.396  ORF Transcript_346/g.396 Transcript_346/m.396 type:complete len:222 (-) Transcript_346:797-1462(-)
MMALVLFRMQWYKLLDLKLLEAEESEEAETISAPKVEDITARRVEDTVPKVEDTARREEDTARKDPREDIILHPYVPRVVPVIHFRTVSNGSVSVSNRISVVRNHPVVMRVRPVYPDLGTESNSSSVVLDLFHHLPLLPYHYLPRFLRFLLSPQLLWFNLPRLPYDHRHPAIPILCVTDIRTSLENAATHHQTLAHRHRFLCHRHRFLCHRHRFLFHRHPS